MKLSNRVAHLLVTVITTAGLSSAATLSLNTAYGNWTSPVLPPDLDFSTYDESVEAAALLTLTDSDGQPGDEEIRWSTAIVPPPTGPVVKGEPQSGLRFDGAAPAAFNVSTGVAFILGTLTHFNNQVENDLAILGATLDVSANFGFMGDNSTEGPFSSKLSVLETINTPMDPDIITFTPPVGTTEFTLSGTPFSLKLLGFSTDGGKTFTNQFISAEGGTTTADLYAIIETTAVPEPSTVLMLSSALALLGFARLRRS